jgi:hydrogenase maturation protease
VPKILVCGVGNKLKGDDGLGPFIIEKLEHERLPDNVETADFGISGMKCALTLEGYEKVVFVDAISLPGSQPGRLHRIKISQQDVLNSPNLSAFSVSLHETDLERILATAAVLNIYPQDVVIVGCQPADTTVKLGLTQQVEQAVPEIIDMIKAELD